MPFFRPFGFVLILGIINLTGVGETSGQAYPTQPTTAQPLQQQALQQQPLQKQEPAQQQPIRMQPLQTPPKSITHNGVPVYQQDPNRPVQPATDRTMPPGYGSPYPTGMQPIQVATTQTDPARQNGSIFNLPPQPYAPPAQPAVAQQPVASQSPQLPAQPITTTTVAAVPQQAAPRMHMGRAEPDNRPQPFVLSPQEQRDLDLFLARWEKYGDSVKQYSVEFDMWQVDPTVPGAAAGVPIKQPFGSFKFVAPDRFVYHVEGERINGKPVTWDEKANPNVEVLKIIIDNKAVYYFDYKARKVRQTNIPPEMARKGIADSPLPLIFGAKSEDLKKRFSMKLLPADQHPDKIRLQAVPLQYEDQQEFRQLEIWLDRENLRAVALKKENINGKAYDSYLFDNVQVKSQGFGNILPPAVVALFNPTVPRGWQVEVTEWDAIDVPMQPKQPAGTGQRNEIQLYSPQ